MSTEQFVKSLARWAFTGRWWPISLTQDLHLKCFKKQCAQEQSDDNCKARLQRLWLLLRKFREHAVDFISLSNVKLFTVAPPVNLQNDRIYARSNVKKRHIVPERLLHCWPTFSLLLIVSTAVSKLGFLFPRVVGIINHNLIAYSLSNISDKNYQDWLMCVKVIQGGTE